MNGTAHHVENVPEVGRAAVLHHEYGKPYEIVAEFPVTKPGPLEVLIRLEASGVCYGDLSAREGGLPAPAEPSRPLIGGHEGVGRIITLGSSVHLVSDLKVGDLVGVGWRHSACGRCVPCLNGLENACYEQTVHGLHTNGTFQEYLSAPAQHAIKIPNGLTPVQAAPLLCAGGTVLAALRNTHACAGQWVAISGAAGGLGHLAIQHAKFMGLRVVAIDGGSEDKKDFCTSLGADLYFDYTQEKDIVDAIVKATGGGVHGSIILSANPTSYLQACFYSRHVARIVGVGVTVIELPVGILMHKSIWLTGQGNATRQTIVDGLDIAVQAKFRVVTEVLQLEDVNGALDRLMASKVTGRIVLSIGGSNA